MGHYRHELIHITIIGRHRLFDDAFAKLKASAPAEFQPLFVGPITAPNSFSSFTLLPDGYAEAPYGENEGNDRGIQLRRALLDACLIPDHVNVNYVVFGDGDSRAFSFYAADGEFYIPDPDEDRYVGKDIMPFVAEQLYAFDCSVISETRARAFALPITQ
jgi:hypothetical protein